MDLLIPPAQLHLEGGAHLQPTTRYAELGAFVVHLSTTIAELGVRLQSTYTGHPGTDTLISELAITPTGGPISISREADHDLLPVSHARRLCAYDHFQRLQDLLAATGRPGARIDVTEDALQLLEQTPAPPSAFGRS